MIDPLEIDRRLYADARRLSSTDGPPPALHFALASIEFDGGSAKRRAATVSRFGVAAAALLIASTGLVAAMHFNKTESNYARPPHLGTLPTRGPALAGYQVLGPPRRGADGRLLMYVLAFGGDPLSTEDFSKCEVVRTIPTERHGLTITVARIPAPPGGGAESGPSWVRFHSNADVPTGPLYMYACPDTSPFTSPTPIRHSGN